MSIELLYPSLGVGTGSGQATGIVDDEPFLVPAIGSRSTPVYNVHSYHTKVPPEAIEPYIEHHTQPGDVILDPFAGSGMTGVAARRLGRRAILNDLSPAAVHIAWNVTHDCDPDELARAADRVLGEIETELDWLYRARCDGCDNSARLGYLIWSDRLICPSCGQADSLWDVARDADSGTLAPTYTCTGCGRLIARRGLDRKDSVPAWVATDCSACGRRERRAMADDLETVAAAAHSPLTHPFPDVPIGPEREMYLRSALHRRDIHAIADFYTPRNLRALAALWAAVGDEPDVRLRQALALAFTNTAWHGTKMRRYNLRGGQRPLTGTLYIPQLSSEVHVGRVFAHKLRQLQKFYRSERSNVSSASSVNVLLGSAGDLAVIPSRSIDYIFTDPPFGSNIFYADCNLIWESWLGTLTDARQEAVVNRSLGRESGGKGVPEYQRLMLSSFAEMQRVLRPDGWLTVVFHSTDADVWRALEEAARDASLSIEGATHLDKTQLSHKGYKGRSGSEDVAAYDVVLAIRNRPSTSRPARQRTQARRVAAANVLSAHLTSLPPLGTSIEADRRRTLPYLHSLLVQEHFNGDIGLSVGDYDLVRQLCIEQFVVDGHGRWTLRAPRMDSGPVEAHA